MGIHTGLDLKNKSELELVKNFGKAGKYFFNIAHGIDDRPVVPDRVRKSLGAEHTFADDLSDPKTLVGKISVLAAEVAQRIKKSGKSGRTLTVKIKFGDFTQITRSSTVTYPIYELESIDGLAMEIFSSTFKEGMEIRLLGITISNFIHPEDVEEQMTIDFE